MRRAGFSMVELVFVVVVLAVLSAVAIPRFLVSRDDACYSKMRGDLAETQATLSREYTKSFLQGKSIAKSDLDDILGTLETAGSHNCYFSVNNVAINNGKITGTITATVRSDTLTMDIENEDSSTTSTVGVTRQPVITCDLNKEMCQKLTGKIKQ